jgi:hypothetical protein
MAIPTVHTENPAYTIIEKLGGKSAVAAELGLDKSALSRWCMARPAGTGGMIPQKWWGPLMRLAQARRVRLTLRELAQVEV